MGRALVLAVVVAVLALGVPGARADGTGGCAGGCGIPQCWNARINGRPDLARTFTFYCQELRSAQLGAAPDHVAVTGVSASGSWLTFTVRPDAGAARVTSIPLTLTGDRGTVTQDFELTTRPDSENAPPRCYGDTVSQRSDGSGPVVVTLQPWCEDPEGDEMTLSGSGPGQSLDSPKAVRNNEGAAWRYRTATSSGTEHAAVAATDVLGARSQDAPLTVTVGPDVDRLPTCAAAGGWFGADGVSPVSMRAGKVRRFGIYCVDPDGDPFGAALTDAPQAGLLAVVPGDPTTSDYWGTERWLDATYVPGPRPLPADPFTVTASGTRGTGPAGHMAMVVRPDGVNGGGSCGWSSSSVTTDLPGTITASCSDDDGDDLTAEVTGQPAHGTVGPAAVVVGAYGNQQISVPYVPDPGYKGTDCVVLRVSDGRGLQFDMTVDITVADKPVVVDPPPLPIPLPPLPTLPLGRTAPHPVPTQPAASPAATTAAQVKAATTQILGTGAHEVAHAAGMRIWAPERLSKATLMRERRVAGLLVVCPRGCRIRSRAALKAGSAARRSGAVQVAMARQPQVVWVTLSDADRARLATARHPVAHLSAAVRMGRRAVTVSRALPIGS